MKLSKETQAILKNFAGINSNIMLAKGSTLSTISPHRNVLVSVSVPEVFTVDFGIYDLNQFLGVLSLFDDPDITFSSTVATIKEGRTSIKYYNADKAVLLLPPDKTLKLPAADITLDITAAMLGAVQNTGGVLSSPDLSIVGDGKAMVLRVSDLKNSSNNTYELEIGPTTETFQANFKIDNLKLMPQDYKLEISSKKLSKWTAKVGDMVVFVALESSSTF